VKRFVFGSSLALVLLVGGLARAQDGAKKPDTATPPPAKGTEKAAPAAGTEKPAAPAPASTGPALRVNIDLGSELDGVKPARNDFLYFVWERLTFFGIRAEVLKPVGDPKLDRYVEGKAARWQAQQPDAPRASIVIVGNAPTTYADAQFYGQGQSHTFTGRVDVEVKDADGGVLATIGYTHNWGRLPADKTKSQTQQEYEQMVYTTAVLALLSRPEIRAGVPEAKQAELTAWIADQKKKLKKPLEGTSLEKGELATILDNLPASGAPAAPAKE
jgi:hypothetical protein